MESNPKVLEAFNKGLKVIDSCENKIQLEGASKFIDQFFKSFGYVYGKEYTELVLGSLYAQLIFKYQEKNQSFS